MSTAADSAVVLERHSGAELYLYGDQFGYSPAELVRSPAHLAQGYGVYAYMLAEPAKGTVTVGTDPMGFTPLYYAVEDHTLKLSTSLGELCSRLRDPVPDLEAWEELYVLGDLIGSKTTVRSVRRLPYGQRLVVRGGEVSLETIWSPEVPDPVTLEEYLERANDLLVTAIRKTSTACRRNVVLLSGGEDSRRIAAAFESSGLDFGFVTQRAIHAGDRDDDVRLATLVAERLGRDLHVADLASPAQALEDELMRERWMAFESVQHGWIMPLLRSVPPGALLFDGLAGGILNGHYARSNPNLYERYEDTEYLADQVLAGAGFPFGDKVLQRHSIKERVVDAIDDLPVCPQRMTYFYLLNHARRNTSAQSYLYALYDHQWCFPFLYQPLLNLSLGLPPSVLMKESCHRLATAALCNALADLPSTRQTLSVDYVTDLRWAQRRRQRLFASRLYDVDWQTLKLLKYSGWKRLGYWLMARFGLPAYSRKGRWIIESLARYQRFSRWLDAANTNPPLASRRNRHPEFEPQVPDSGRRHAN